ncbi:MAG: LysR substrate-binding domain-containing protein [Paracoccaceae bacterium]
MNQIFRPPAPSTSLDLDILRSVIAIADGGSIVTAAQRVARTPAAVSMQIKKLEEMLGRNLFTRTRKGMTPTAEGERLLSYARKMLDLNREAVQAFSNPELSGTISIGMTDSFGGLRLAKVLSAFASCHPKVVVNVTMDHTSRMCLAVDAGELDLAVFTPGGSVALRPGDQVLAEEQLAWIAREGGRAVKQVPVPLAVAMEGCAWRRVATEAIALAGIETRIAYVADFDHAQIAAVEADLAVAPMPKSYLKPGLVALNARDGFPALGRSQMALRLGENAGPQVRALAADIAASYGVALAA